MKIGVFGDSYADRTVESKIWWRVLEEQYGHKVTCYGQGGSSILFSARLLEQHYQEADFNIWCLTTPGRMSFKNSQNQYTHYNGWSFNAERFLESDYETSQQMLACENYLKYLHDEDDERFLNKAMVDYHLRKSNVMIIPCFHGPLMQDFYLQRVNLLEVHHYLPGWTQVEIHKNYIDKRNGHLTPTNHDILAAEINQKMSPGIFQTDIGIFQTPQEKFEDLFKKKP